MNPNGQTVRAAFLSAPLTLLRSNGSGHAVLRCNAPFQVSRRARIVPRMCSKSSDEEVPESKEPVVEPVVVPEEPYPGFFADMERTGTDDEEARSQALKAEKQKSPVKSAKVGGNKNLLKPDGTPYAPWMNVSDYDPTVIKKRTDATGRLAADPQLGELSGVGLTWKMLGDELELAWATGTEDNNRGFVVYRRQGKEDKWEKLADYREAPGELASRGPKGGKYSFLVRDTKPGSWVYRISDVDENQNVSDLAQVLVEVESAQDKKTQYIALAVLLAVLAIATIAGFTIDPLSST